MSAVVSPSEAPAARSMSEVWVITIGHALTHWYPATFYVLLPLIGNEMGLSYGQIGMILTAQYLAGAISNLPGGMFVDSVGRKGLLMATSLFWIGVPYLIMGFSNAYWVMVTCSALIGIGNNLWHPTAIPWLGQRYPERKGLVMAWHGMGGNVGDALAPIAAGALVTYLTFSWRHVMIVNILPGVVMAIMILWYLGKTTAAPKKDPVAPQLSAKEVLKALPSLFRNRTLVFLSTSSAFRSMTQNGIMTFLPLYLAKEMGYSPWLVGLSMFSLQAAGFIAAPIAGHMSDKVGRRNVIMSSMIMTGAVLAFMVFAGRSPMFVGFIALLGFFLFAIRPVLQAWLLDATPKNLGGSAIGAMFGIQALGSAVGPLICGAIADSYGLLSTFWFLAVTIILANLLVFVMPTTPQEAATQKA
ncbi:MFS transporter [Methylocella sp. CPCC 101449]|jgi:MFS family permease|uniref:MFS transporter n=1 Tax=Methylocella sp. CPCC 101449 TaxID=2987531 RepID=UPI002891B731|nr:MFS transporter [Methylocella sp. CPCC 101449]MDT2019265.1 MFS transporter [Methylocella sp. CPCC 101449]HEV2573336.1 MFS transporter [Beijerinckiaceae bacterium]